MLNSGPSGPDSSPVQSHELCSAETKLSNSYTLENVIWKMCDCVSELILISDFVHVTQLHKSAFQNLGCLRFLMFIKICLLNVPFNSS